MIKNRSMPFRFTDEEMEIAKGTDLPELLEHLGYSVRRAGSRYHTTREMDSLMIKDRRTWKRYSSGKGGDAISSSQSPLHSVSACGENCVRSLAPPLPTKSSILRGPQAAGVLWQGFPGCGELPAGV